jgi:demethylmenaquinone methyltransferase/2-methoxy-6-polyprenyl-1,4-benzoquinol methylase
MNSSVDRREERAGAGKRAYVREMFSSIAPQYDFLNHLLSLNVDRAWRRAAVRQLRTDARPDGRYLDLCAGTLDLAIELRRQPRFRGTVVGADFAIPMLHLGVEKDAGIRAVGADALTLPFPDATFDGCMIAFGIRNLVDIGAGLAEMARVLRPGGRLVILEFSLPTRWPVRPLYAFYFRHVLPRIGRIVSKHTSAYTYLPDSVAEFPQPDALTAAIGAHGFRSAGHEARTLGIVTVYHGTRT